MMEGEVAAWVGVKEKREDKKKTSPKTLKILIKNIYTFPHFLCIEKTCYQFLIIPYFFKKRK